MTKPVPVFIKWNSQKLKNMPKSGIYSTVAKFLEDVDWPKNAWSVVVEFHPSESLGQKNPFEATARFLVQEAPWDRLKSGAVFDLYEGSKQTARVTVV